MIKPMLYDVVELLADLPEYRLYAGAQGTLVNQHTDNIFEVEFANDDGETVGLHSLSLTLFIVVWRAEVQQWVPVAEQVAQIVQLLPDQTGEEVLDFALFLNARARKLQPSEG